MTKSGFNPLEERPARWGQSPSARTGRRRAGGFTILEVLLSLFVVATAAVLLAEGYTQNLRAINANRVDTTLAFLAQWKMAEYVSGVITTDEASEGTFEEEGYPDYEWAIAEEPTDTTGLTEVSVTARQLGLSAPREFTLHRLVYQPEEVVEGLP